MAVRIGGGHLVHSGYSTLVVEKPVTRRREKRPAVCHDNERFNMQTTVILLDKEPGESDLNYKIQFMSTVEINQCISEMAASAS